MILKILKYNKFKKLIQKKKQMKQKNKKMMTKKLLRMMIQMNSSRN